MATGDILNSKLYLKPLLGIVGKLHSQNPTNGSGDFTVSSSSCDEIDENGDSIEVVANMPRFDFRNDYVQPIDTGYYTLNGTTGKVEIPKGAINGVADDFEFNIFIKTGSDITTEQTLIDFRNSANDRFSLQIMNGQVISNVYNGTANDASGAISVSTDYMITLSWNAATTTNTVYINSVIQVGTTTAAHIGGSTTYIYAGISGGANYPFSGDIKKIYAENRILTTAERLDLYNGISTPYKYVDANNYDFTAGAFSIGKQYRILTVGTTDFTLIGASSNTVGLEFTASGVGSGTGTATRVGNTIDLSIGRSSTFWYDLTHDSISAITGSLLVNNIVFGSNAHGLNSCPSLKLEPSFTNYFLNSRTPVTQTVSGLSIGTTYTINAKGTGIITVDETGGNGIGGTVTEVNPLTYIATATSIVITLVSGEAFDWVQLTNTKYAMNHVETLGTSVTKAKDKVTGAGTVSTFNSEEGVLFAEISALYDDGTNRYISISDGSITNSIYLRYVSTSNQVLGRIRIGGVSTDLSFILSDSTKVSKIAFRWGLNNLALFVDGVKVASNISVSTFSPNVLTTMQFDIGDGTDEFFGNCYNASVHPTKTDAELIIMTT